VPPRQSPSQPVAHERRVHAFTPPPCEPCSSPKTEVTTRKDYPAAHPLLGLWPRLERAQAGTRALGQLGRPQGESLCNGRHSLRRRLPTSTHARPLGPLLFP
jgi:hypothetical protein